MLNITVIGQGKVIDIYSMEDDFCKLFSPQIKKITYSKLQRKTSSEKIQLKELHAICAERNNDAGELINILHAAQGLFGYLPRCVGACGLAPVVTIGGKVYGRVTQEKVRDILADYYLREE